MLVHGKVQSDLGGSNRERVVQGAGLSITLLAEDTLAAQQLPLWEENGLLGYAAHANILF